MQYNMGFLEKYTTQEKIDKDTEGKEDKKTILSNDAYAISELVDNLINKIEQVRLNLITNG